MIIIGHHLIEYQPLFFIKKNSDIQNTLPNSTVVFEFTPQTISLCKYCLENDVDFALIADNFQDVIIGSAFDPKYLICDKAISTLAQKFADDYVLDLKILYYGTNESELEWAAKNAIDGIIFEDGISYEAVE